MKAYMTKTKAGRRLLATLGPQVSMAIIVACTTLQNSASAQTNQPASQTVALASDRQVRILWPKDSIEVKVYQEDDLDTKAIIDPSGVVTLPLIGQVHLGQKTPDEAAEIIRSLYATDYLVNPRVSLTVLEEAKIRFTVMGQVQRPGSYEFTSTDNRTSLIQAVRQQLCRQSNGFGRIFRRRGGIGPLLAAR
jgi:protein involved in polysaccharide export with SLBB domain